MRDVPAIVQISRAFTPLRALLETVFGKDINIGLCISLR